MEGERWVSLRNGALGTKSKREAKTSECRRLPLTCHPRADVTASCDLVFFAFSPSTSASLSAMSSCTKRIGPGRVSGGTCWTSGPLRMPSTPRILLVVVSNAVSHCAVSSYQLRGSTSRILTAERNASTASYGWECLQSGQGWREPQKEGYGCWCDGIRRHGMHETMDVFTRIPSMIASGLLFTTTICIAIRSASWSGRGSDVSPPPSNQDKTQARALTTEPILPRRFHSDNILASEPPCSGAR